MPRSPMTPPKMLPNMEARFFQHLCLTLHMTSVNDGQSAVQTEALLFAAPTPLICAPTAVDGCHQEHAHGLSCTSCMLSRCTGCCRGPKGAYLAVYIRLCGGGAVHSCIGAKQDGV